MIRTALDWESVRRVPCPMPQAARGMKDSGSVRHAGVPMAVRKSHLRIAIRRLMIRLTDREGLQLREFLYQHNYMGDTIQKLTDQLNNPNHHTDLIETISAIIMQP